MQTTGLEQQYKIKKARKRTHRGYGENCAQGRKGQAGGPGSSVVQRKTTADKGMASAVNSSPTATDRSTEEKKEIRPLEGLSNSPRSGTKETYVFWVNYFISHNLTQLRESKEKKMYKKIPLKMFWFYKNVRDEDS